MKSATYLQLLRLLVALCVMIYSSTLLACPDDQYEQCVLGACICLPKIGGDVGKGGEDTKREANILLDNIAREIRNTPSAIQACLNNTSQCVNTIISAPLVLPVQAYIEGLYRQSEGRTYSFSPEFIALAQPYYSVDLRGITWANDINTGTGMSVSYCDRIFFAGHGNAWQDPNELHHVLHELEHTVQCQARGRQAYLAEYVLKVGVDILKSGRFNVHDMHDYEVAAEAKANQLTNTLWNKIQSGTVPVPGGSKAPPGFPSGFGMQVCGCWGFNPMPTLPEPRCASGAVRINMCDGFCLGGGSQYAYVCQ